MDPIQSLEETALRLDSAENRVIAFSAMLGLGLIYENGSSEIPKDWGKSFDWYEKAAAFGSKLDCVSVVPAYYGLCRVVKNSCFNTKAGDQFSIEDMLKQKQDYADYLTGTCDPRTVNALGWPEIAFMVGAVCKDVGLNVELHQSRDISHAEYYEIAAEYFHLGRAMPTFFGQDARPMCAKALRELQDRGYGIGYRPIFEFKLKAPDEHHL